MDAVQAEAERIREWCGKYGVPIVLGDCIRQTDAARYLGRAIQTLRNWGGDDLPIQHFRSRAYYQIEDLARFIVGG